MKVNIKTPWDNKKKRTAVQVAQKAVNKAINQARGLVPVPRALQGMKLQALRTGGWSNPSQAETKFIDTSPTFTLTAGANTFVATPVLLNGCIQGTEATQRLGRKISMTSMYLKGNILLQGTTVGGGFLRLAIVYDKQSNGTAPAITDVWLTNAITSPNNLSNRDRFVKVVDIETPVIGVQGDFSIPVEIYRKLNLETLFNTGNAGTVGDITTGSLHMFICNNAGFTVAPPVDAFQCRIKFTDH